MRLRQFSLINYRAYSTAAVRLPDHGLSLFAGPNNSGKSALLSAIDILVDPVGSGNIIHNNTDGAVVTGLFSLNDTERESLFNEAPVSDQQRAVWTDHPQAGRQMELRFECSRLHGQFVLERISLSGIDGQLVPLYRQVRDQNGQFVIKRWNLNELLTTDTSALVSNAGEQIGSSSQPQPLMALSRSDVLQKCYNEWRAQVIHFAVRRGVDDRIQTINATRTLTTNGSNLPNVLLWLRTNDPEGWQKLSDVIAQLVPALGELQVRTSGTSTEIVFHDGISAHNLKDLGTGVEQLLLAAYVGIAGSPNALVIIEEPETNLHPGGQRQLLYYLSEWAHNRQLLFSTHSALFLDGATSFGADLWSVDRAGTESTVRAGLDAVPDVLRALGVRLGDLLSSESILLVEGPSDARLLEVWFSTFFRSHRTAIIPVEGGDWAWRAERFSRVVGAANTLPLPVLFLRDRDEMTEQQIRALSAGPVHVLKKRELENYLLDADAIAQVLAERVHDAGNMSGTLSAQQIDDRLQRLANQMRTRIVLKRVAAVLGGIRILPRADIEEIWALASQGNPVDEPLTVQELTRRIGMYVDSIGNIGSLWDANRETLNREWEHHWRDFTPGGDLLDALWHEVGLHYDKSRDGERLARQIPPPAEIVAALSIFDALPETGPGIQLK